MYAKILASTLALTITACATPATSETQRNTEAAAPFIAADQQAFLDACEPWDKWDKSAPPFKIFGGTYYVGTCGIASILVVGDGEHVLIDSGTKVGAEIILRNIKTLGFDPKDIAFLLYSHEHFDHVGGHAVIKQATGASVIANRISRPVFETGIVSKDDPQFGTHDPMTPVDSSPVMDSVTEVLTDGLRLRAIQTPGHSPGALTWTWQECEERCENIVYADSLSPVSRDDYKFSEHPQYLAEYRTGLARLERLERQGCSLLLTPHPSHSRMLKRMQTGKIIQNALGDKPCADYAAAKLKDLQKRLFEEARNQ